MELKKKPPREEHPMISVWVWSVKEEWIFSLLPDMPCAPFYVAAGWHLDMAKQHFLKHVGWPPDRVEFVRGEAPASVYRKRRDPVASQQLRAQFKEKFKIPIYSGDKEIGRRAEHIAAFEKDINEKIKNGALITKEGSLVTYYPKKFKEKLENKGWSVNE